MSLANLKDIYRDADAHAYAIINYDVMGGQIDLIESVLEAAEATESPVIIGAGYEAVEAYLGLDHFASYVRTRATRVAIPVVLHLDHAFSFAHVMRALREGFTSVMFDGSRLPYEENLATTHAVVQVAHSLGVPVEAELGAVGGLEGDTWSHADSTRYTDPDTAHDFVTRSGIDAFAPAIGNAHGFYQGEPKLDFDRLTAIAESISVPLVLHGATGIPHDDLRHAISRGIRKINLGTVIHYTYACALKDYFQAHPDDHREYFRAARQPLKQVITEHLHLVGSAGRA